MLVTLLGELNFVGEAAKATNPKTNVTLGQVKLCLRHQMVHIE